MPQPGLLLDLLTGPVELTLLKDAEQIATGADALPLLLRQSLLDEPCLALGKALPHIRTKPTREALWPIAGHLAVQPCRAIMVGKLFERPARQDRKSVAQGKSVSVRVDLVGRRILKRKTIRNV